MSMERPCLSSIDMSPKASANGGQMEKVDGYPNWVMCGDPLPPTESHRGCCLRDADLHR